MSREQSNIHMDNCTNEDSLKEEGALITTLVKINEQKQINQVLSSSHKKKSN
jgi:hypothetical protein